MDQGLLKGGVFIDLRKAFDSLDDALLVNKLMSYGLSNTELNWFRSYLTGRRQVVNFGRELSEHYTITSGVSQGSILGPLLFVLFINDLPVVLEKCNILMYADDTVIYVTARHAEEIGNILTNELAKVNEWLLNNNLFMHKGKTECILFGTDSKLASANFSVSVNGSDLKRISEYKYLGVVMDECLTWKAHVKYLLGKVGKRIGMLGRARKNISMHSANKVYKSYIIPVLDYGDTVWNCCGTVNSDKLERLQRRAARIIMKSDRSETALKYLRYATLKVRREMHVLSLVQKCISKKCPHFLMEYFKFNRDILSRITLQSDNLRLPFVKLESTKKAFFYHGCRVFNENLEFVV